jgi:hypothetical protein
MAKTWRRAIKKYGSLGAISFEKAFRPNTREESLFKKGTAIAWERACQIAAVATAQPVKSSCWRALSATREGQAKNYAGLGPFSKLFFSAGAIFNKWARPRLLKMQKFDL